MPCEKCKSENLSEDKNKKIPHLLASPLDTKRKSISKSLNRLLRQGRVQYTIVDKKYGTKGWYLREPVTKIKD